MEQLNLTDLEMAELELAMVQAEIEELEEREKELKTLIAELSAEDSDNPNWTDADELLTRMPVRVAEIEKILRDGGDRGDVYWCNINDYYNVEGMFATLTEEVSPDTHRMYVEAQSRLWRGYLGGKLTLALCYTPEGELIEGRVIPWYGNMGPYKATMFLQNEWAHPNKVAIERSRAARNLKWADFYYRMAVLQGRGDEYLADHPHYVPE